MVPTLKNIIRIYERNKIKNTLAGLLNQNNGLTSLYSTSLSPFLNRYNFVFLIVVPTAKGSDL